MLVLSRKEQEAIRVGDDIVIRIVKTGRRTVKIGIDAPEHLRVAREELECRLAAELPSDAVTPPPLSPCPS